MAKKLTQNAIFNELQESLTSENTNDSVPEVSSLSEEDKKILNNLTSEPESLVEPELARLNATIKEIQDAIDTIKLLQITDLEEKIKAINAKITFTAKMTPIIAQVEDLRSKNKLKQDKIRGKKDISLLESGEI